MNEYFILSIDYISENKKEKIHPVILRDDNDLILIDCGYPHFLSQIKTAAEAKGIDLDQLTKIIITHQDYDHLGGLADFKKAYPNVKIYASKQEAPYIRGEKEFIRIRQMRAKYKQMSKQEKDQSEHILRIYSAIEPVQVDEELNGGEQFDWCGGVEIIPTPGHMPGHISIYLNAFKVLVAGDALAVKNNKLSVVDTSSVMDVTAAKESMRKLLTYDIQKVISYHGGVTMHEIKKTLNDTMSFRKITIDDEIANSSNVNLFYVRVVKIVYFTGTGGTEVAAKLMEEEFIKRGLLVLQQPLDINDMYFQESAEIDGVDLIVILYPVYASDAPGPIYDWIDRLPEAKAFPCAVISVSAGGEIWPNTASRTGVKSELQAKGYDPFYERMLLMPSNAIKAMNNETALRLIEVLPDKVRHTITQILSGIRKVKKAPFGTKNILSFARVFRKRFNHFAENFKVNENCNGCGWCAKSCPVGTIKIVYGKPVFSDTCVSCMRCVYGCPKNAIEATRMKSLVIDQGYDLTELMNTKIPTEKSKKIKTGLLYYGAKKYLKNLYKH